jgi:hypothetical protein
MSTAMKIDETRPDTELTIEKLKSLNHKEIMELFSTLSAPIVSEMDGEYEAGMLNTGSVFLDLGCKLSLQNPLLFGYWLCKSFTPGDDNKSHGYNSFRKFGKVVRKFRMKTEIASSRYDGKDIFELYYPAYKSLLGAIKMVDEVRKIKDGLYLGIGTWGFTEKQRMIPLPFYLSGPIHEFVGPDRDEL